MKSILKFITSFLLVAGIFGLPHGESSVAEDDSDMLMEPDELPPPQYSVVRSESRVVPMNQYTPNRYNGGFVPMISPRSSVSRVEHFEPKIVARSETQRTAEQNFFPAFYRTQAAANSHSRPYKTSSSSNAASIVGRYSASGRSQNFDQSILGSGDFSVIRGGTFYPDDKAQRLNSDEFFGGFYNNGHGRPSSQPLKTRKPAYYPDDPFEHFTDFADINTENSENTAFSHYSVIYANKNGTKSSHPKNIFEQLQLIDLEKEQEKEKVFSTTEKSEANENKYKKLSKFKSKLSKTKVVKKYKKHLGPKAIDSSTDYIDPLMATS